MHKKPLTYDQMMQRIYSLLMIVVLLWLTVSTPFVYQAQQEVAAAYGLSEEETGNPFSNTTEERVESGVNTLSEYLHEYHQYLPPFSIVVAGYKCHPDVLYSAFHPELLSPPPEGLL